MDGAVTIFLGLGSNLGDRSALLKNARQELNNLPINEFVASPIYESEPYQGMDQPSYYNQVVGGVTSLSPTKLLESCLSIEKRLGRVRGERWGSRLVDIDILYYQDLILDTESLIIPHMECSNRGPVLLPLNDLAPDWEDPRFCKPIKVLLEAWRNKTTEPIPVKLDIPYH